MKNGDYSSYASSKPLSFTILTQYYPPEVGAPQVRLAAMARALRAKGCAVAVVTAMPNYPAAVIHQGYRGKVLMREVVDGVDVTRSWIYPATGRNTLRRLLNYVTFMLSSCVALVATRRTEILFVETPPLFLCFTAWLVAFIRHQKLCLNISDLWPDSVRALGLMNDGLAMRGALAFERWLYRHAWRVCAVTEGMVRTLECEKGVSSDKVRFLPNGVDVELFRPGVPTEWARRLELQHKIVFVFAGTHGYAQGLDVILNAATLLQEQSNITFLFIGDGPEKERLQVRASEQKLCNVTFADPVAANVIPEIFGMCRASIVPLLNRELFRDARPSKIMPSLSCGLPVIYSGSGEAAKIITDAECGLVTPPEDSVSLSNAVLAMANDPQRATEMGRRGRQLAIAKYSWSQIVDQWLEAL